MCNSHSDELWVQGYVKDILPNLATLPREKMIASGVLLGPDEPFPWCPIAIYKEPFEYVLTERAGYFVSRAKRWLLFKSERHAAKSVDCQTLRVSWCPKTFEHQADAKAACERHYATGKWD